MRGPVHPLPAKIEEGYQTSVIRRRPKCSREDYAAGFEDGYRKAIEEISREVRALNNGLLKP